MVGQWDWWYSIPRTTSSVARETALPHPSSISRPSSAPFHTHSHPNSHFKLLCGCLAEPLFPGPGWMDAEWELDPILVSPEASHLWLSCCPVLHPPNPGAPSCLPTVCVYTAATSDLQNKSIKQIMTLPIAFSSRARKQSWLFPVVYKAIQNVVLPAPLPLFALLQSLFYSHSSILLSLTHQTCSPLGVLCWGQTSRFTLQSQQQSPCPAALCAQALPSSSFYYRIQLIAGQLEATGGHSCSRPLVQWETKGCRTSQDGMGSDPTAWVPLVNACKRRVPFPTGIPNSQGHRWHFLILVLAPWGPSTKTGPNRWSLGWRTLKAGLAKDLRNSKNRWSKPFMSEMRQWGPREHVADLKPQGVGPEAFTFLCNLRMWSKNPRERLFHQPLLFNSLTCWRRQETRSVLIVSVICAAWQTTPHSVAENSILLVFLSFFLRNQTDMHCRNPHGHLALGFMLRAQS